MSSVLIIRKADSTKHTSFKRTLNSLKTFNKKIKNIIIIDNKTKRDIKGKRIHIENNSYSIISLREKSYFLKIKELFFYNYNLLKTVKNIVRNKEIDFVYLYDLDSASIVPFLIKNKIPYIYHIADFYSDSRIKRWNPQSKLIYNLFKKIEFKVMEKSFKTIICTEERREQIKPYGQNNVVVIHNSVVEEKKNHYLRHVKNINNTKIKLGYVGSLSSERNIKEILKYAKDHRDKVEIYMGGYGPLQEKVEKYSLVYSNIKYFGPLENDKDLELYSNVDYILAMYQPEGYNTRYSAPNKFYESLYLRKPILVLENTGVDFLVKKFSTGFVFENIKEFKEEFLNKHDSEKYDQMKKNCMRVEYNYSWEKQRNKLHDLYKEILEKKDRRSL